jgi:dTDP-4-dehydrorhamnose 3,5-epimerase
MNNRSIVRLNEYSDTKGTGLNILEIDRYSDDRGYFQETFKQSKLKLKSDTHFLPLQLNTSFSQRGVFRGIHQSLVQNKLVFCLKGEIVDFAIDLRNDSKLFGSRYAIEMSEDKPLALFLPKGFGHGFYVSSSSAIVAYLVDAEYISGEEINWYGLDTAEEYLEIERSDFVVSEKDMFASQINFLT